MKPTTILALLEMIIAFAMFIFFSIALIHGDDHTLIAIAAMGAVLYMIERAWSKLP